MQDKYGVMLMAFGGPASLQAVEPFVTRLLGGKKVPQPVMESIKARYRKIGGGSPLVDITRSQAGVLQNILGEEAAVVVGMCYSEPTIAQAVKQLVDSGITEIIAVSMSPHYSRVSTGAYRKEARRVVERLGYPVKLRFAGDWYDHPLYLEAVFDKVNEAMAKFSDQEREDVEIIFSAHSLPLSYIEEGEPYLDQLKETVSGVAAKLTQSWQLAFQSKGRGQGEWLGPQVENVLDQLAEQGRTSVLVVPVSFVAEHVETLYDIDIEIKEHAQKLGLNFHRSAALNDNLKFMQALAEKVQETVRTFS